MAGSGSLPSTRDPGTPSTLRGPNKLPLPLPVPQIPSPSDSRFPSLPDPSCPAPPLPFPSTPDPSNVQQVKVLSRSDFLELFKQLPTGSILFPGCKAYEQAIFIGNLLYRFVTPSAIVQAVTVHDVTETVKFARRNNIKLSIKSGGHSMGGYCLNEGGIVLDISSMNTVKLQNMTSLKDFVQIPKGTVSIQGGAVWHDAYSLLKAFNKQLVTIGGNCPSVGVSAFLLGGGVSPFSRKYGLGIDSLEEMTIVTAEGEIVTVTGKEKDPKLRDLFWAVRGGGGGNFGITVGVKVKLHYLVDPDGTVVSGNLTWKLSEQEKDFKAMMQVWNDTAWPEEVRGDALWHYDENNVLLGKMTIVYNGNWAACIEAILPLLKFNPNIDLKPMHWTDWEVIDGKVDVFEQIYHHHASFIFGKGGITPEVTNIITDLMREKDITENDDVDCYILWHHIGEKTTEVKSTETAFFWRDGYYVFHVKVLWSNPRHKEKMFDFFKLCKQRLVPHSIQGKAAYLNYIDPTVVENWQEVYYGDNYTKLREVKTVWDKDGFFSFPQGLQPLTDSHQPCSIVDLKFWKTYALQMPQLLGNPKTPDQVYSIDAGIRRAMIGIQS